jgi:dynein heavy chain
MEAEWKEMNFDTKEYRTSGTRILCGIDEIQQLLDDQIVKTQAMKGSRFIKPFIVEITKWEETLTSMQDILDNWMKVQSTWLYLEPIFSSEDIMRQVLLSFNHILLLYICLLITLYHETGVIYVCMPYF